MTIKAPWHLWLVGILAILWNSIGAIDYIMTQSQNEAYMSSFSPEQLEYFYAQPFWLVCAWAIAIWSSVLASILLLFRKKLSQPIFLISLVGVIVTSFYSYGLSNGYEIMGGIGAAIFSGLIFIIAAALYLYSKRMSKEGILN